MYKINIKENLGFVYDLSNYLMVLVGIVDDY